MGELLLARYGVTYENSYKIEEVLLISISLLCVFSIVEAAPFIIKGVIAN